MVSWKGKEGLFKDINIIHISKIKRKPKPVGIELKAAADGESGILIHVEIQEGALAGPKEFEDEYQKHAAMTIRLCKDLRGSGRVISGDAYFTSLQTCRALMENDLYYLGVLKGCHSGYPKQYFNNWKNTENPQRGSYRSVVTTIKDKNGNDRKVLGVGWIAKRDMVKTFIGTYSNTLLGQSQIVPRSRLVKDDGICVRVTEMKSTTRPQMVEDTFKYLGVIDFHDRLRQGMLNLESSWKTKHWWIRLFTSLFGMCITDAYLAYKLEYKRNNHDDDSDTMNIYEFTGELAYSLIYNDFFNNYNMRNRESIAGEPTSEILVSDSFTPFCSYFLTKILFYQLHYEKDLNDTPYYIKKRQDYFADHGKQKVGSYQIHCSVTECKRKVTKYCFKCTQDNGGEDHLSGKTFVGYCNAENHFHNHLSKFI